jgi:uncharacterized membrane protein YkoI
MTIPLNDKMSQIQFQEESMSQRTALLVTTALTVFVMVMMIGVVWQLFQKSTLDALALQSTANNQKAETATITQPAVPQPAAPESDTQQATQAQIAEREASYQQLIQQANARLDQAYKQQQELVKQIEDQKANAKTRTQVSQQPKFNVSSEQAVSIALAAVPGAVLVKPAELVSFKETPSYVVTLDKGVVYVDANTGKILYNSATVVVVNNPGSGGGGGGGGNPPPPPPPSRGGGEDKGEKDNETGKGD